MDVIAKLRARAAELSDLHHVMAIMQWDQEVMMPVKATAERAQQFATMSGIIHRKEVDPALGDLLAEAESNPDSLVEVDRALVRKMRRNYEQSTRLPESFVVELSALNSQALPVWSEARRNNDFNSFAPLLQRLIEMSRRQAEYFGYTDEPYDALLDIYEEGLTASQVGRSFQALQKPLTEMLAAVDSDRQVEFVPTEPFSAPDQSRFADQLLKMIGFDFERGRQDRSAHPFSTGLGGNDQRVTNRYHPQSIEFIFSALHEGGHALYEQNVGVELARTPLGCGVSLGIHESQSRLWENIIGRSVPFWQHCYPMLSEAFPAQFGKMSLDDFMQIVNAVRPGLIRVEADELSYNLHVLIRFELERALIAGELQAKELPVAWNERYREYLGVTVPTDSDGVLQDIHWAHGSFGYFPTYTIGNLASAQIWQAYCAFDPEHAATVANGDFSKIRNWFTGQIYQHGSVYPPNELLLRVTGEELQPEYFLRYLKNKFIV